MLNHKEGTKREQAQPAPFSFINSQIQSTDH